MAGFTRQRHSVPLCSYQGVRLISGQDTGWLMAVSSMGGQQYTLARQGLEVTTPANSEGDGSPVCSGVLEANRKDELLQKVTGTKDRFSSK